MQAVRLAVIEDLRLHDLRHEATTRLLEKGLNIMEVASTTGHKVGMPLLAGDKRPMDQRKSISSPHFRLHCA
jgi:integrase